MPGWPFTQAVSQTLQKETCRDHQSQHYHLSRQSARLHIVCNESDVLSDTPFRKIVRSIHEDARELDRALANTDAYTQSRRDRKKVEMLFAHLKTILRLTRLRLRGLTGAQDEFLLAGTAQNLRKLAKLVPAPSPEAAIVT